MVCAALVLCLHTVLALAFCSGYGMQASCSRLQPDVPGPADMAKMRLASSEALLRLARMHDSRIHPEVYLPLALAMQARFSCDSALSVTCKT